MYHFATGQRELNLTKKEIIERITEHIYRIHGSMPQEDQSEILLTINTNVGHQHFSIPVTKHSLENFSIDIALKLQESRILVENERTRITRERFEVLLPQCGLFAHIYQMKGFYSGRDPFRVNCYVMVQGDYFPACALKTSDDISVLQEMHPGWDVSLLTKASQNEIVVFLASKPWELLLVSCERVTFL